MRESREMEDGRREGYFCFGLTLAVIAVGALSWIARLTILANASSDIKFGLSVLYMIVPMVSMMILAYYRGRAMQQWVAQLCSAAMSTYVVVWAVSSLMPTLRDGAVALMVDMSIKNAMFAAVAGVLGVMVLGVLLVTWYRVLKVIPKKEGEIKHGD